VLLSAVRNSIEIAGREAAGERLPKPERAAKEQTRRSGALDVVMSGMRECEEVPRQSSESQWSTLLLGVEECGELNTSASEPRPIWEQGEKVSPSIEHNRERERQKITMTPLVRPRDARDVYNKHKEQ
jgi:hypothetical protein